MYYHILPEHHILQKEPTPCNFLQIQQMSPLWLIRQLNLCLQLHMPARLLIPNQWTTLHRSLWRLVTADEATRVYSPTKNLIWSLIVVSTSGKFSEDQSCMFSVQSVLMYTQFTMTAFELNVKVVVYWLPIFLLMSSLVILQFHIQLSDCNHNFVDLQYIVVVL